VTSRRREDEPCEFVTPLVFGIDGWQNYDNTDDDNINDFEDSSRSSSSSPTEETVKLISHTKYDWTICESLPSSNSSSCSEDDELNHSCERGFYDVSMLTGGCYNYHVNGFVHPDVHLESVLSEHHKQRLIANQIFCEQPCATSADCLGKKFRPNNTCCQGSYVRPDDFWIKEPTASVPSDGIAPPADGANSCGCDTTMNTVETESQNDSVKHVDSDCEMDNSTRQVLRPLSVYELEDINVEPGIVYRTKLEIEQRDRCVFIVV
jgi:hypothetical protein